MTEYTPEELEIIAEIKDKMRGGPRRRLINFAHFIGVDYDELIERAKAYVTTNGNEYWSEGGRFEGTDLYDRFWPDFELVTGIAVPSELQYSFFSCSC